MSNSRHNIESVYYHDLHKLYGQSHEHASDTIAGVRVNQSVPFGADADAAAMSRPTGTPEQTVPTHATPARLSLLTGDRRFETLPQARIEEAVADPLATDDPDDLHRQWLDSDVFGAFNESVYYPYTSLKYHTLLVAALCDAYYEGHAFADLALVIDPPDVIVPHRTIYAGEHFACRLTSDSETQGGVELGEQPRRSWARTWARLPQHPLAVDHDREDMVLDANLRRIRSWSTALQYIEDVETVGVTPANPTVSLGNRHR